MYKNNLTTSAMVSLYVWSVWSVYSHSARRKIKVLLLPKLFRMCYESMKSTTERIMAFVTKLDKGKVIRKSYYTLIICFSGYSEHQSSAMKWIRATFSWSGLLYILC